MSKEEIFAQVYNLYNDDSSSPQDIDKVLGIGSCIRISKVIEKETNLLRSRGVEVSLSEINKIRWAEVKKIINKI